MKADTSWLIAISFCKLLQKMDLKKINVSSICKGAAVSRSTFYVYYDSILSLKQELENKMIADIMEILEEWKYFRFKSIGEGDAAPVFVDICRYCCSNKDIFQALLGPYGDKEFSYRFQDAIYQDFLSHVKNENSRFPELIASSCTGAMIGLMRTWRRDINLATPEELAQLHTAIAFRIIKSTDQFSELLSQQTESSNHNRQK